MKQHITISQLNELSEKGKDKLREWWKPQVGDKAYNTEAKKEVIIDALHQLHVDTYGKVPWYVFLPLLSIGQMIEFIAEHSQLSGDEYGWLNFPGVYFDKPSELCYWLWEEIKKILEK